MHSYNWAYLLSAAHTKIYIKIVYGGSVYNYRV